MSQKKSDDDAKHFGEGVSTLIESMKKGEFLKDNDSSKSSYNRNIKTERGAHIAAEKLSNIAQRLSKADYKPTMKDVWEVLQSFCEDWYGYNLNSTIAIAIRKIRYDSCWGHETASITTDDYNAIKNAWIIIKEKCNELLCSDSLSSEMYIQEHPNSTRARDNLIQFIDKVIEISPESEYDRDREQALRHVNVRLYTAFYGKELSAFSDFENDGMGDY